MNTKIIRFLELASTNDYAKSLRGKGENVFIVAEKQSGGRGTKGRSFSSKQGGLYFSKLTFYDDFPAAETFKIMQGAAAAVCETLSRFGLTPVIKWPNDVYVNGKKICGILIENALSGKNVGSSVVGVGLNVNNELPNELKNIATSMREQAGETLPLPAVEETLFALLNEEFVHEKYRTYLGFMGQSAKIIVQNEEMDVILRDVDDRGNLIVDTAEGEKTFSAAEVTLRVNHHAIRG